MVKLKIEEKEYGLRFDMYAMEMIEDEFGSMGEMMEKLQKERSRDVITLFVILANAYLAYEGKEESVKREDLRRLKAMALKGLSRAVIAAIKEGMKSETSGGNEADDEVYDVYLAELESKN